MPLSFHLSTVLSTELVSPNFCIFVALLSSLLLTRYDRRSSSFPTCVCLRFVFQWPMGNVNGEDSSIPGHHGVLHRHTFRPLEYSHQLLLAGHRIARAPIHDVKYGMFACCFSKLGGRSVRLESHSDRTAWLCPKND